MKLEIEISDETLSHVIDGAGISYWALLAFPDNGGAAIWERDGVVSCAWPLPAPVLARGLQTMARVAPGQFGRLLDPYKWDATTGDVLIQCALFGEVRYG